MAFDYDYFVIGAGSGGVRSSRIASGHGAKVAIAEDYRVGGTCVIRGCVPKKLLVIGAHFAEGVEDAARYGWQIEGKRFDWPTLRDAVNADVDRLNRAYHSTLDNNKVETFLGRATLVGENRVRVALADGDREFTAKHVLIATGAKPMVPDLPGAELGLTSNEMFHLETLPKRAVIAGAGFIATEFAGILNALGVEVTMLVRGPALLRGWDAPLAERLAQIYTEKGIKIAFETRAQKIEKQADGSLLVHTNADPIETDMLLWATGRVPHSADLGLEALGVELGDNGLIPVNEANGTSLPWLHAVGDVTDRVQLTPVAIREGHALADRLFGNKDWRVDYNCIPSAVFSNPPIASVGLTEAEARAQHGDAIRVFSSDFRPMQHVLSGRNERCLYRLIVHSQTDVVLGAHMIGPESPEILQAFAVAVKAGLTKAQIDQTVALHPSMAEELVLMR